MSNYGSAYATIPKSSKHNSYTEPQRKHTVKRTLKQKFREWLFDSNDQDKILNGIGITIDEDTIDSERCIKFKVFNASGGRIIETSFYDSQKDRNRRSLYVITNDQEIGHEIDKIITMEHLKQ